MQPPVYMHNGYMMIYPPIPPGNMHIYGMENGTPGTVTWTHFALLISGACQCPKGVCCCCRLQVMSSMFALQHSKLLH